MPHRKRTLFGWTQPKQLTSKQQFKQDFEKWRQSVPGDRNIYRKIADAVNHRYNTNSRTLVLDLESFRDQPQNIVNLPPIPPSVTEVALMNIVPSCNIDSLLSCAQLKSLRIFSCPNIIELPSLLSQLPQLELLEISCSDIDKLPYLPQCTKLKDITLRGINLDKFTEDVPQLIQNISVLPSKCNISIHSFNDNFEARHKQFTDALLPLKGYMSRISYTGPNLENITLNDCRVANLPAPSLLEEKVATWMQEGDRNWNWIISQSWKSIGKEDKADTLVRFLGRLRETREYRNKNLRPNFLARVCNLLEQLQNNEALRENCIAQAYQASETCGDRAAIVLLDMEKSALVFQAESDVQNGLYDGLKLGKLIDLGKGMYRLAKLEAIAQKKITALRKKDEYFEEDEEVHLAYIVEAAKKFPLPIKMDTMLHRDLAKITKKDIKIAIDLLKSDNTKVHDPDFLKFLANWSPMQKCLQKIDPDVYEKLQSDIREKIESKESDLRSKLENLDNTNENKYKEESDKLMQKFNVVHETVTSEIMSYYLSKLLTDHEITASLEGPQIPNRRGLNARNLVSGLLRVFTRN